jgi:hypothetical protein
MAVSSYPGIYSFMLSLKAPGRRQELHVYTPFSGTHAQFGAFKFTLSCSRAELADQPRGRQSSIIGGSDRTGGAAERGGHSTGGNIEGRRRRQAAPDEAHQGRSIAAANRTHAPNRTEARSPVDGWITNLSLRQSDYAIVGQVVDAHSFWIAGYFDVDSLTWAINVPNARANATGVAEVSRCSPGSGSPSTSLCGYLSTLFLKTSGSCKA